MDDGLVGFGSRKSVFLYDLYIMIELYGVFSMVEIFYFLCFLLNMVEYVGMGVWVNIILFDEDVFFFALNMINLVIELGGVFIRYYLRLLSLI